MNWLHCGVDEPADLEMELVSGTAGLTLELEESKDLQETDWTTVVSVPLNDATQTILIPRPAGDVRF